MFSIKNSDNGILPSPVTYAAIGSVMTRDEVKTIMNIKVDLYDIIYNKLFMELCVKDFDEKVEIESNSDIKNLNEDHEDIPQSTEFDENYKILKKIFIRSMKYLKNSLKNQKNILFQNLNSDILINEEKICNEMIKVNENQIENENNKNESKSLPESIEEKLKLNSLLNKNSQKNILPAAARKNILFSCRLLWQVI